MGPDCINKLGRQVKENERGKEWKGREGQKEGERKRDSEVILRRGRDKGRGSKR